MADVKSSAAARPSRRERARATRLRMTRAAYQLFTERGYAATTMADIAQAAGVAVQTVYFTFHTKTELLQRVYELAVLGEGEPVPPQARPWWSAAMTAERLDDALRHVVTGASEILARAAALDEVVRAASADPDTDRVRRFNEQLRRDGYADMINRLGERFGLRSGVSTAEATDLLLLLLGPRTYVTLVLEDGWSEQRYRDWCVQAVATEIFAPQPP